MNKKTLIIAIFAIILIWLGTAIFINSTYNFTSHPVVEDSLAVDNSNVAKSSNKTADIGFEMLGKINFIGKKVGDHVSVGEVLAKIDDADLLTQYAQAESGISIAQADLAALKNSLKVEKLKLQYLKKSHAKLIQEHQVNYVKNNILAQEARMSQAQAMATSMNVQLGKAAIRAPFDGTITRQSIDLGEIVSPNVSVISILADNN